jgi:hypothetical protein
MPDDSEADSGSSIDNRHHRLVGAGPGLGMAVARRFADDGYRVTLVARSMDGLGDLADSLADTGAQIDTIAADASDPEGLGARMAELYNEQGAPGLIIYNEVMGAPDKLLSSSVEHLQTAYAVDVISAIVVTQVAAPAMRAGRIRHHHRDGWRFRGSSDPSPRDHLPRQSSAPIRRHHAGSRFGAGWHSRGDIDDRGADRCGHRLRSREHRKTLLGGRPFRRSLAGGVSFYRRIGSRCGRFDHRVRRATGSLTAKEQTTSRT